MALGGPGACSTENFFKNLVIVMVILESTEQFFGQVLFNFFAPDQVLRQI